MKQKKDRNSELCYTFYHALISALRYKSESCGYAIAVHGSLKRDIDLVACPWREMPIPAESLVSELKKVVLAVIGTARERECDNNPEKKP